MALNGKSNASPLQKKRADGRCKSVRQRGMKVAREPRQERFFRVDAAVLSTIGHKSDKCRWYRALQRPARHRTGWALFVSKREVIKPKGKNI